MSIWGMHWVKISGICYILLFYVQLSNFFIVYNLIICIMTVSTSTLLTANWQESCDFLMGQDLSTAGVDLLVTRHL